MEGGVVWVLCWILTQTWKVWSHRDQLSESYPVLKAPRLGSECQEPALPGLGVSLVLELKMDMMQKPELQFHVNCGSQFVMCHDYYQNHQNVVDIDPLASNLAKPHGENGKVFCGLNNRLHSLTRIKNSSCLNILLIQMSLRLWLLCNVKTSTNRWEVSLIS